MSKPFCLCYVLALSSVAFGTVMVNPNDIDVKYRDGVEVTADVPSGAWVTVDLIVDFNRNGQVDGPDFIWQHYDVRDGGTVPPPGSPEVADTDGLANGQIRFRLGSFFGPYEPFPAGRYIIRLRSGTTGAQGTLTVQAAQGGSVTGKILLNGTTPTAGAVYIETADGDTVSMIWTDESGYYAAGLPAEKSLVLYGVSLAGSFGESSGRKIVLSPGGSVTGFNLNSPVLPYRCRGRVVWALSQTGVPYLILSGWLPLPQCTTLAVTDEQGYFDFGVDTGGWEFYVMDYQARGIAMKRLGEVKVTNYDITGIVAEVTPVTCYIYGTVEDVLSHGRVPYVELHADNETSVDTRTDGLGQFAFGVSTGTWYVNVDNESACKLGFLAPAQDDEVSIYSFRLLHDFEVKRAEGWVNCHVQDKDGKAVSRVAVECQDARSEWQSEATTGFGGNCRLAALLGEDWVSMSSWSVEARGYEVPPGRKVIVKSMPEEASTELTLLPPGWPVREYEVWVLPGDTWIPDPGWPDLYGGRFIGKAASSATFHVGMPPSVVGWVIVTHQGKLKVDAIRAFWDSPLGHEQVEWELLSTGGTPPWDWQFIGTDPDGKYALVGVSGDDPDNGYVLTYYPVSISVLQVILPDQPVSSPLWASKQSADNTYHLEWSEAGNYELEFDTSAAFRNPVPVDDVSGLTSYDYSTEERRGFFRLREK